MNPEPFSVIEGKYKERKTGRDKEKNDFEKRASILGWIITLALAGVPYLLLAVGHRNGQNPFFYGFSVVSLCNSRSNNCNDYWRCSFWKGKEKGALKKHVLFLKNSSSKSSEDLWNTKQNARGVTQENQKIAMGKVKTWKRGLEKMDGKPRDTLQYKPDLECKKVFEKNWHGSKIQEFVNSQASWKSRNCIIDIEWNAARENSTATVYAI